MKNKYDVEITLADGRVLCGFNQDLYDIFLFAACYLDLVNINVCQSRNLNKIDKEIESDEL